MNIQTIIDDVLKQSVRYVSKQKFIDKADFEKKANEFINSIKSNLVKLNLVETNFSEDESKQPYQHWTIKFEAVFVLDDPYIDSKVYESGTVYIFPSKKFYDDVEKTSMKMFGAFPEWDSTRNNGTITGNARDY
jgi:hypothetical protein